MLPQISIQGHRGVRGYYPENTVRGFIEAIKLGVDTLEMDVVISSDQQVVVSHEAWMNERFCSLPNGNPIEQGTEKNYNLYQMTYADIKKFDCGKRGHAEFPMQIPIPSFKPLLSEVIASVEIYVKENNLSPISYNIELKTEIEQGLFNPAPKLFSDLIYREIKKHNIQQRITLQSFDVELLKEIRKGDASMQIGLLIENQDSFDTNLARLGFIPNNYNPDFVLVNSMLVKQIHERGMKIIPWTVNEKKDMEQLLLMGVDGIISDYPDRLIEVVKNIVN